LQGSSGGLVGRHDSLPVLGTRFDGGAQDGAEEKQSGWHASPMIALSTRSAGLDPRRVGTDRLEARQPAGAWLGSGGDAV